MQQAHSEVFFTWLDDDHITFAHVFRWQAIFKCEIIVNDNFHILHALSMLLYDLNIHFICSVRASVKRIDLQLTVLKRF